MKHFLIVTNDGKDREYKVTDHVKNLLEQAGMTCVICEKDENKQIIREAVPKELDCAIVIGGDGSFIEAARYPVRIIVIPEPAMLPADVCG